jgi:hypothetical protein
MGPLQRPIIGPAAGHRGIPVKHKGNFAAAGIWLT